MIKRAFFLVLLNLIGCEEDPSNLAPVVEGPWQIHHAIPRRYQVQPGDTLYSIAFRYDQDPRSLATINQLHHPYVLKAGKIILLKQNKTTRVTPTSIDTQRRQQSGSVNSARVGPSHPTQHWQWPIHGPVVTSFAPELGKKGIDIAGSRHQTIRATANGWVAYAGDGLPGYGHMILIQHDNKILSAYGYNARNLVRAGQKVSAGQPIALVGMSPQHRYATHFELRKAGKPINPRYFLH